jgi:hypothetical protein
MHTNPHAVDEALTASDSADVSVSESAWLLLRAVCRADANAGPDAPTGVRPRVADKAQKLLEERPPRTAQAVEARRAMAGVAACLVGPLADIGAYCLHMPHPVIRCANRASYDVYTTRGSVHVTYFPSSANNMLSDKVARRSCPVPLIPRAPRV